MGTANEAAGQAQYLAFSVGNGEYALGILKVKEILQHEELTKVPGTPQARALLNSARQHGKALSCRVLPRVHSRTYATGR